VTIQPHDEGLGVRALVGVSARARRARKALSLARRANYDQPIMAVGWNDNERARVEDGIRQHPVTSGRCAALARVVYAVGHERDPTTRGRQVRPPTKSAARFIVPKVPHPPRWGSHTFVEAHAHAIDVLTGVEGCPAPRYLETHWEYADHLEVHDVDVDAVDRGIEDGS